MDSSQLMNTSYVKAGTNSNNILDDHNCSYISHKQKNDNQNQRNTKQDQNLSYWNDQQTNKQKRQQEQQQDVKPDRKLDQSNWDFGNQNQNDLQIQTNKKNEYYNPLGKNNVMKKIQEQKISQKNNKGGRGNRNNNNNQDQDEEKQEPQIKKSKIKSQINQDHQLPTEQQQKPTRGNRKRGQSSCPQESSNGYNNDRRPGGYNNRGGYQNRNNYNNQRRNYNNNNFNNNNRQSYQYNKDKKDFGQNNNNNNEQDKSNQNNKNDQSTYKAKTQYYNNDKNSHYNRNSNYRDRPYNNNYPNNNRNQDSGSTYNSSYGGFKKKYPYNNNNFETSNEDGNNDFYNNNNKSQHRQRQRIIEKEVQKIVKVQVQKIVEKQKIVQVEKPRPIGRRVQPQVSIYLKGCKLTLTCRRLEKFKTDILIMPFKTLKLDMYPGYLINSCQVGYKQKIKKKGDEMQKQGAVYLQKCIGIKQFQGFAFMKIIDAQKSIKNGISNLFEILGKISQKAQSVIFPICKELGSFKVVIKTLISQIENYKFLKDVYITTQDHKTFCDAVTAFNEIFAELFDENQISIN